MDIGQLKDSMRHQLKTTRYQHCIGAEEISCDLAVIYGYDMEKAAIAGILHDCAKYLSDAELLNECRKHQLPVSEVEALNVQLLHAKVGAFLAKERFGIEDEEILNAIYYHTTGRPGMSLLEKIIFTADYIEPYRRELPGIDAIREAAYDKLDLAVAMILKNTLEYLRNTGEAIDTMTEDTYEYYKQALEAE